MKLLHDVIGFWIIIGLLSTITSCNPTQLNQNIEFFIHENASENAVCKMAVILSRGRWVEIETPGGMKIFANGSRYLPIGIKVSDASLLYEGWILLLTGSNITRSLEVDKSSLSYPVIIDVSNVGKPEKMLMYNYECRHNVMKTNRQSIMMHQYIE